MPYSAFSPPVSRPPTGDAVTILGLVGLVGALVFCGLPLVVSPFAWAVGRSALKEIEESQGRIGGASNAKAGMIMGIIGTVILVLALILVVVVIIAIVVGAESTTRWQLDLAAASSSEPAADQHRLVDQGDPETLLDARPELAGKVQQLGGGGRPRGW